MDARVLVQALEDLGVHPRHPVRRLPQALAIGVLSHRQQDLPDGAANPRQVHLRPVRPCDRLSPIILVPVHAANRLTVGIRGSLGQEMIRSHSSRSPEAIGRCCESLRKSQ